MDDLVAEWTNFESKGHEFESASIWGARFILYTPKVAIADSVDTK